MKNIFGYDSKVMQVLSKLGDLILLSILFLICCVPVFTIGAAQAAMHRAVVAMKDPESDYTWFRAFCMGFKDGFWRISCCCRWRWGKAENISRFRRLPTPGPMRR